MDKKEKLKKICLEISNKLDADQNIDFEELGKEFIGKIWELCSPEQKTDSKSVLEFLQTLAMTPTKKLKSEFDGEINKFIKELNAAENGLRETIKRKNAMLVQVKASPYLNLDTNDNRTLQMETKFQQADEFEAKKLKQEFDTEQEKLNQVQIFKNQAPENLNTNLCKRLHNIVFPETIAEEARANRDRPEKKEEKDVVAAQSQKVLDPYPEKMQLSQSKLPQVFQKKNNLSWPNEPSNKNPIQRIESSEAKTDSPFFKFILQSQENTDLNDDGEYKYKQNIKNVRKAKIYYQTSDGKLLGIIIEGESDQQIYRFGSCKEIDSEYVTKDEQSVAENKKLVGITYDRKRGYGVFFGFKFIIE